MKKQKTRFPLAEPFEETGRWWLPEKPDAVITGILKYQQDEISLELNGILGTSPDGTARRDFDRFPVIHGITNHGKPVTLLLATVVEYSTNFSNIETSRYVISYTLMGALTENINDLRFTSTLVRVTALNTFMNRNPFKTTHQGADGGTYKGTGDTYKGGTIVYTRPEDIRIPVESLKAVLEITHEATETYDHTSAGFKISNAFHLIPDTPQPLLWFTNTIRRLSYLLTLLTDDYVVPEAIRCEVGNESKDHCCLLYRSKEAFDSTRPHSLCLFFYAHLESSFPQIVNKWFSFNTFLNEAIELFINAHRDHSLPPIRFRLLAEALETFSRTATKKHSYLSRGLYRKVRKALTAVIPDFVQPDHFEVLLSRICFGNDYSLKKRVETLLESLDKDSCALIYKDHDAFVSGFKDTRNYFAHHSRNLRNKALKGGHLYWCSEKLIMLLRILLLRHIGIQEPVICSRVQAHNRLRQYIAIYLEEPEVNNQADDSVVDQPLS